MTEYTAGPQNSPAEPVAPAAPARATASEVTERRFQWRTVLRSRAILLLYAFLLLTFGVITVFALGLEPLAFDVPVTLALQRMQWGWFDWLMVAVSEPGFWPWQVIIPGAVMAVMLLMRLPYEAGWLFLAAISSVTSELVKVFVQRPRPTADLVSVFSPLSTYSFPSGHVTHYVSFYGFIFYLAYTGLKRGWLRTAILIICGALVLLVGPSRVWLGQHWASDALGGYTLGFLLLLVLIQLHRAWAARRLHLTPVADAGQSA